jgi:hypothetical protein
VFLLSLVEYLDKTLEVFELEKRCAAMRLEKLEKMKPDIVAYNERRKKYPRQYL